MSRSCKVCSHKDRYEIDRAIIRNTPHTQIAKLYKLSNQSIRSHSINHLPKTMAKNAEIQEVTHSEDLLTCITELVTKTKAILEEMESKDRPMVSLACIRELREIYSFMCKMSVYLHESQRENEEKSKQKSLDALKENLSVRELLLFEKLLHKAETGDGAEVIDDYDDIDDEPYPTRRKKEVNEFFDDEDDKIDVEDESGGAGDDAVDKEDKDEEARAKEEEEIDRSVFNLSNFNKDWTHGKLSSHGKLADGSGRRVSDL